MVICNVCQGKSFELQDGHYFCKVCHTQAEDWREEELEVNFSQGTRLSILMASFRDEQDADADQQKDVATGAWSTWEGLNNILVGQIRELEHLATLPPDFQFTAFNIWAKFLQSLGVCFTKMSFPVSAAKSERDLKWILQENLQNKRKRYRRKRKKKVETEDESEKSSVRSAASLKRKLANQQYLSDTSASSVVSTSATELEDDSDAESKSSTKIRHRDLSNYKLTRKTLLGIIYLALRLTESQVQLFDLLRWLNYNHISYRWVEHMLPGESCLNAGDSELFGPKHSLLDKGKSMAGLIFGEAKQIHMVINYPFISSGDLQPLVQRLVKELCLPDALVSVVKKMLAVANPNLEFKPDISRLCYVPIAEVRVVAMIIFVMKLLFGLDDVHEYQLSNWAEANKEEEQHFVWTRWVELIELRKSILADHFFWAKQLFNKQAVQTENNTIHLDPSFLPAYTNKDITNSTALNSDKKRFLLDLSAKLIKKSEESQTSSTAQSQVETQRPDPTKSLTPMTDGLKIALESGSFSATSVEVESAIHSMYSSKCDYLLGFLGKTEFEPSNLEPDLLDLHEKFDYKHKNVLVRIYENKVLAAVNSKRRKKSSKRKKMPVEKSKRTYWMYPLKIDIGEETGEQLLQSNLPISFLWLLRLCSSLIDSTLVIVYKELAIVETELFLKGQYIEDPILRRIVKPYRDLY